METVLQDVRYALRMLRKSPGFTTVAVITLALGIGANTAIFTVVNALLLKMLPVRDPQQLVVVGDPGRVNNRSTGSPRTDHFSYPLYKELRDHNSVFSGLCAASTDHGIRLDAGQGGMSAEKVSGRLVSGNYFSVLGLEPAAGRLLAESDDTTINANPVVVLGYGYWQRRFALSPSIIGKDIRLNDYSFTVVGVAPAGFDGDVVGEEMAVYLPLSMQAEIMPGRYWLNSANASWLMLIGRLKPGETAVQAEANLNLVLQQGLKGNYGAFLSSDDREALRDPKTKIQVSAGGAGLSELRVQYRIPLLLMMGIVGLVLLIACVNVANLLLARASGRQREIAVRLAIGANWRRLLQQLLTESIVLALLGGIIGSLLSIWGVRLLVRLFGSGTSLPLLPDARVLAFAIAISLLTGILFGVAPTLRVLKAPLSPALKGSGRSASERSSRIGWNKGLIAGQVALSLLVLFAASLLVRSLQKLLAQDFGYAHGSLVVARLDPLSAGYDSDTMKDLAQQLVSRVEGTPGVRAVTYSKNGLFAGTESDDAIIVPGFNATDDRQRTAREDFVGPDYFGIVGIPILEGRGIEAQDTANSTRTAVVNQALVKHFFQGQNPIGRQFKIDDPAWVDKPITIVGVSRDAKERDDSLRESVEPRFYLAFQQMDELVQIVLDVQVTGNAAAVAANLRREISATDPHVPISFVHSLDSLVNESIADQIALAKLSAFFGGLALLLACVGLYGVMSYTVAGRTREIGVRMALGAKPVDVLQLVMRDGMALVGVGLAIGVPVSLGSGNLLRSFLFDLKPTDPVSLTLVVFMLGMVAAVAALIPARRAARVDPMVALRYE